MLERQEARKLALRYVNSVAVASGEELVLMEDQTIEREFGWVFFYNTKEYAETGDEMAMAIGNAPLLVDRRSGEIHETGADPDIERYIRAYEIHGTCHPGRS